MVDATAVAAAAVQGLQAGLEDGLIELGTQYLSEGGLCTCCAMRCFGHS